MILIILLNLAFTFYSGKLNIVNKGGVGYITNKYLYYKFIYSRVFNDK